MLYRYLQRMPLHNYDIACPADIIPGIEWTAARRRELLNSETLAGKDSMKCEDFQRNAIFRGTGIECPLSNHIRIHEDTLELKEGLSRPYAGGGGDLSWTENFDGIQFFISGVPPHKPVRVLYNFKSICEAGGSQTRSLKCIHDFIRSQVNVLEKGEITTTLFANILDGKFLAQNMRLLSKFDNNPNIYIGDLHGYFSWLNNKLDTIL